MAMVFSSEVPDDLASAFKSFRDSCPNQECIRPNVSKGHCHSCGTVVDKVCFAAVIRSEACFNKECKKQNVVNGYCCACNAFNFCPNMECKTPVVQEGVCQACGTVVGPNACTTGAAGSVALEMDGVE